jgi:hypothetical protein
VNDQGGQNNYNIELDFNQDKFFSIVFEFDHPTQITSLKMGFEFTGKSQVFVQQASIQGFNQVPDENSKANW